MRHWGDFWQTLYAVRQYEICLTFKMKNDLYMQILRKDQKS